MAHKGPTILNVMSDPELLGSFFQGTSWQPWKVYLRALFGLPLSPKQRELYEACTGRKETPREARETFNITSRRGGKTVIAALIATYLSCFRDYSKHLQPGERANVLLIAADRQQARQAFNYIAGFIEAVPMLRAMIVHRTRESIELSNRVVIGVHTCSFRSVRGYTVVAAICDEIAFWRDETSANPDHEVLTALRPGLASIPNSRLVCIGSPYSRRGELWRAFREHYGKESAELLVWQSPSRVMNPTLSEKVIEQARERDPQTARSEWFAEFRSDLQDFIPAAVVESCVEPGCRERLPVAGFEYSAFVDPSGGSQDSMTLAVAHKEGDVAVLDLVRERKPPFSPDSVVEEFAKATLPYGVNVVVGDRFGGSWVGERFQQHGITYEPADKTKSELYLECLPLLNAGRARLLDNDRLRVQLCSLERRTSRSGRDSVDHPPGGHDDIANAVAGALVGAAKPVWKPQTIRLLKGGGRTFNPEKQILERYIRIRRLGGGIWAPHDEAAICDYVESRGLHLKRNVQQEILR